MTLCRKHYFLKRQYVIKNIKRKQIPSGIDKKNRDYKSPYLIL